MRIQETIRRVGWVLPVGAAALLLALLADVSPAPAGFSDWPKYNFDLANTGMSTDTTINTGNAASLKLDWTNTTGSVGAHSQPTVVGNVVYWNTWDGSAHAAYISGPNAGHNVWMTNLGFDHGACTLGNAALSGAPAYGSVNGTPAVFVVNDAVGSPEGPDTIMYALDAATGATIWSQVLATDPAIFTYSSPVYYNGAVYYSTASAGDCPLIDGHVYKVDANTHAVVSWDANGGARGTGIWGSPAIDTGRNEVYYATGAPGGAFAFSIVGLDATTLAVKDQHHFALGGDSDFGSSPVLFSYGGHDYLGIGNKNAHYYILDRANIGGAVVHDTGALGSAAGSPRTQGEQGPALWDGRYLYIPTGNSGACGGTVNKLDPATWTMAGKYCSANPIITSVAGAPGIAVVATSAGTTSTNPGHILVLDTSSMSLLFDYTAGLRFWAAPSIGSGHIFAVDMHGQLYALSPGNGPPPPTPCNTASDPPANLVASSGAAGQFSLTWTPPTTCPGSPTYYAVALYSAATNSFTMGEVSTTSFSATGLSSNTYYIATVTAYNQVAWSGWSTYSNWILVS